MRPFSLDPALFPRLLAAHAACRLPLPPQRFGSAVWRRQSRPVWTRRSLASRVGAQSGSMAQAQLELRPHVGAHPELRAEAAPDDQDPSGSPREEDPRSALRKLQKKMSNRRYEEKRKKMYAENKEYREKKLAYFRKKYAEDEEYRVRKKISTRRYKENSKAKIAMVARMARAREKKDLKMYREQGLLPKGQGEEGNAPGEGPPQKAKMARIVREAGMELDEVREKELFEQMMTAQANLLKHVADVVVVCRAQCERLQQPRA